MKKLIEATLLNISKRDRDSNYSNMFEEVISSFKNDLNQIKSIENRVEITDYINKRISKKGLYIFFYNNKPIYVGIAKNIRKRLMQHVNGVSSKTSSLAYKIAKEIYLKENGAYYNGTKEDFFSKNLDYIIEIKKELKQMKISTIEINDNDKLALFEIYCSLELKTSLNSFETH